MTQMAQSDIRDNIGLLVKRHENATHNISHLPRDQASLSYVNSMIKVPGVLHRRRPLDMTEI